MTHGIKTYNVYMHTTPDGKVYVGMTSKTLKQRCAGNYKNNKEFNAAIMKYGWKNIKSEVIYTGLSQEEAEHKEIALIAFYGANSPQYGYNKARGGKSNSGCKHTTETKAQIAASLRGVKHTPERLENQRKAQLKLWQTPGHREKMSAAHIGKQRGKDNPNSKIVYQFALNGALVNTFESSGEAARLTGIDRRQISAVCNGRQDTAHGYIWRYTNEV